MGGDEARERATRPGDRATALLAAVLGHPLRVRILEALATEPASASTLTRQFGDITNGDAFYHLRVLERCRIVEVQRSLKVRGATESIYALRGRASWGGLWDDLSALVLGGWRSIGLRQFVEAALSALDAGSLDEPQATFSAAPLTLDREGFETISGATRALLETAERVEAESCERLQRAGSDKPVNAIIAAAAFDARGGGDRHGRPGADRAG